MKLRTTCPLFPHLMDLKLGQLGMNQGKVWGEVLHFICIYENLHDSYDLNSESRKALVRFKRDLFLTFPRISSLRSLLPSHAAQCKIRAIHKPLSLKNHPTQELEQYGVGKLKFQGTHCGYFGQPTRVTDYRKLT